jgi:hypothetical protein
MTTYQPHGFYKITTAFGLLLSTVFAWEVARGLTLGALLFLAISLGIVLWSLHALFSQVQVTAQQVCVAAPLQGQRCVEFRQLLSVSENGRLNPVITLVYHPQRGDGLLDLAHAQSLTLPAVRDQEELLVQLQTKVPA